MNILTLNTFLHTPCCPKILYPSIYLAPRTPPALKFKKATSLCKLPIGWTKAASSPIILA